MSYGSTLTVKCNINVKYFFSRHFKCGISDFPRGPVVQNPPAKAGHMGSIPAWEDPTCLGAAKPVHHNY